MSLEDIFSKLATTTVTTVSRIALSHATNAAIRNVTHYISQQALTDNKDYSRELQSLQRQLDLKIKNLKPAVDMISHSVANGNQDLEASLEMCNDLKRDLDAFTYETEIALKNKASPSGLVTRLKAILHQVDDTLPSIYLSLRSIDSLVGKVSSSKLIQASTILQHASASTLQKKNKYSFTVTLYSLFAANVRTTIDSSSSPIECVWKEEARKCTLTIEKQQQPSSSETIQYHLVLKEDMNDGLYHDAEDTPKKWNWKVDHIKKLFFTKSGTLLNIEDAKASVLVIKLLKNKKEEGEEKIEKNGKDNEGDDNSDGGLVKTKETVPDIHRDELKLADWFAVEIWKDNTDEEDEDGDDEEDQKDDNSNSNVSQLDKQSNYSNSGNINDFKNDSIQFPMSLLLLESTIKLALMEVTEQIHHLNASDELLNTYMS